ncbi:hypothetical protein, partial [Sulfuricurvum sp.]|uniref:hypothetical protein n=1 Tax=Sulfuricurvum sp. TaxID=2025608 RepID=UPI003BB60906
MKKLKYDVHLSAFEISRESITALEKIGFSRDEFTNNTRCERTAYHATYRGTNLVSPDNVLWDNICAILQSDSAFIGALEEEEIDEDEIICFQAKQYKEIALLPSFETKQPAPDQYKACDIHINIDLEKSDVNALKHLDILNVASFDKPIANKIHRIFTVTTDTLDNGYEVFAIIGNHLQQTEGLSGKMKFEKTTRHFRKP